MNESPFILMKKTWEVAIIMQINSILPCNLLRSRQGFTLIEMLVVAVLQAIITAISMPLLRDNVVEASYVPEAVLPLFPLRHSDHGCYRVLSTVLITTCLFGEYIHFPRLNSYSSLVIA